MKVVAFNGSPRRDGNTAILIRRVLSELEKEGIETELVQLSDTVIHGCIACEKCAKNRDQRCAVNNDATNAYIEKMIGADGIVLGSPAYLQDITSDMKALIERIGHVVITNGRRMLQDKVGASLVALRRTGGISSIDSMNHFFLAGLMIIVGQGIAFGREIGEVERDDEGMGAVTLLGQRMARLLNKIGSSD